MVPGPPQTTGGDDDELVLLILFDLHQHLLENREQGEDVKGQHCSQLGQGIGGRR